MLPNLSDFSLFCQNFHWGNERKNLSGLPGRKGLNIAFEAVERHANSHLKGSVALRRLRKDKRVEEATYADLQRRRSQFANVIETLGVVQKDAAFSFAGRVPGRYIAALGTLKKPLYFAQI
ncbi:MAG: hypothetical protein ACOYNO_15865 [Saprospiraceae bacterium]